MTYHLKGLDEHTIEALLTDTRVSGQLYLQPPWQTPFYLAPIPILYLRILVSGQLQLRTLFLPPEGVRLWELQLIPNSYQT